MDGEGIKEIAETARIEDRNLFEALVPRIYELGGKLQGAPHGPDLLDRVPVIGTLLDGR